MIFQDLERFNLNGSSLRIPWFLENVLIADETRFEADIRL